MTVDLKARVQRVSDRIDALELRERLLLLAATIIVLFLAVDSFALSPTMKSQQLTQQRIADLEMKIEAVTQQANLLSYKTGEDPLAERYASRDKMAATLEELDARILNQLGALVSPTQAAKLLEEVLTGHRGLQLKSLRASTEPLSGLNVKQNHAGSIGRYQLDLVLVGGYLDLMRYLKELEAMPWKFFWEAVDFQVEDYPHAVTHLKLYTLGAQDG